MLPKNGSLVFLPFPAHLYDSSIHNSIYTCKVETDEGVIISRPSSVRAGNYFILFGVFLLIKWFLIGLIFLSIKWMPSSLSGLTPIIFNTGLTDLGSDVSIYIKMSSICINLSCIIC